MVIVGWRWEIGKLGEDALKSNTEIRYGAENAKPFQKENNATKSATDTKYMQGKLGAMRRVEIEGIRNSKKKSDLAVDKGRQSQLHIQNEIAISRTNSLSCNDCFVKLTNRKILRLFARDSRCCHGCGCILR